MDRCLQAVVRNALEPEWEAQFEARSYGFRPGRGCHDAIEAIFATLGSRSAQRLWILDADLKAALTHAIRMAAFNTQTALARTIKIATGYAKADNEAHALVRTALAGSGDIIPAPGTLHIRLDPMHTPRATAAIAELCTALNGTVVAYPGTDLQMHYSVKPRR